jgi:hypothetical protein
MQVVPRSMLHKLNSTNKHESSRDTSGQFGALLAQLRHHRLALGFQFCEAQHRSICRSCSGGALRHSCWQTRRYCLTPAEVEKRYSFPEQSLYIGLVPHRSPPPAATSRLMSSLRPWHPSTQLHTMRGAFAYTSAPTASLKPPRLKSVRIRMTSSNSS